MRLLGYDTSFNDYEGSSPASLGLRIARTVIEKTYNDGANEANNYDGTFYYKPINKPLWPPRPGNPLMYLADPNRWYFNRHQYLKLFFILTLFFFKATLNTG